MVKSDLETRGKNTKKSQKKKDRSAITGDGEEDKKKEGLKS